jgi:hypothetical protein
MRLIAAALLFLIVTVPSQAEYWDGDNLLACLVGKGVVEIRHGALARDALEAVAEECVASASEPPPAEEPEGDSGDYLDYVFDTALRSLEAITSTDGIL